MNPWQEIPLADYEAHMQSAAVDQLAALSELFDKVMERHKPVSVAVLGVAGGNGLVHIDSRITRRIVGVDLNPDYLAATRERFHTIAGLELYAADLSQEKLILSPVDLVHVALLLEHAGTGLCLENALALVAPHGTLSVVLQLPSTQSQNVGGSGVASISKLSSHFQLVDHAELTQRLAERGMRMTYQEERPVPAGKSFWLGIFARDGSH